jgi:predicted P-loop ATPase
MLGHNGHNRNHKLFATEERSMAKLIPFPEPNAEAHAQAETERKRKLFAWADAVLQQLGLTAKVAQAQSIDDLRKITFDINDVEVELAIRDALHPTAGPRAEHFTGMKAGALRRLLKKRFDELKNDREAKLLHGRTGTAGGSRSSPHSWTHGLKLDDQGGIRPILTNLILFLREHPTWKDVLAFDEFHLRVVVRKRPYWGNEQPDMPLVDHHETMVRTWFENEDIIANQSNIGRAIQAAARFNRCHPVQDYLNSLTRDGKPRIDTWLSVYLGADDSPYTRAIGPRILISAVARILTPGCKVDTLPVLEGPQGQRKSTALRTLFEPWYADRLSAITSKDAAIEMAGVWGIEVAEMEAINRATTGASKSFISRQFDRYRPPYARHLVDQPRQSILVGTINPPDNGYLKDPTGSRRIWPFRCGVIDIGALASDRDQLWAEAVARFKAGAPWWLETPQLEQLAAVEQAARYKADEWEEPIKEWLGDRKVTTVHEVLEHVLGLNPKKPNRSAEMRVAAILKKRLGFSKSRVEDGVKRNVRKRRFKYWRP